MIACVIRDSEIHPDTLRRKEKSPLSKIIHKSLQTNDLIFYFLRVSGPIQAKILDKFSFFEETRSARWFFWRFCKPVYLERRFTHRARYTRMEPWEELRLTCRTLATLVCPV